jgi:mannose-6-phosphate isomerase-like protein (cupin superfamily)
MSSPAATHPAPASPVTERRGWQAVPGATRGRFEGADHGGPVSGFVVDAAPGEGPGLHWHPYAETFVVLGGRARFVRGEDALEATAGDLVVVPPRTLHRFEAVGPERLRMVTVHAAARMEQTFVDG